jgi:DNA topoisomerase I-like protein
LATVVRLLETSMIRVGNEEYARRNRSFGLTTLRNRHVNVSGSQIQFEIRGKSGVQHAVDLNDRRLARIIKQCQDLPGHELFQYVGADGQRCTIGLADVNEYLRGIAGDDFSSKDFRTWAGTVLAARTLVELHGAKRGARLKANIVRANRVGRQETGQHQSGFPKVLYPSGGDRSLQRRLSPGDFQFYSEKRQSRIAGRPQARRIRGSGASPSQRKAAHEPITGPTCASNCANLSGAPAGRQPEPKTTG